MGLRVYNTLGRKKEEFQTLQPGKVSMYVCGPTVYSKAHIGHAMSALVLISSAATLNTGDMMCGM